MLAFILFSTAIRVLDSSSLCFSVVLPSLSVATIYLERKTEKRGKTQGGRKPLQYGAKRQQYYLSKIPAIPPKTQGSSDGTKTQQTARKTSKNLWKNTSSPTRCESTTQLINVLRYTLSRTSPSRPGLMMK